MIRVHRLRLAALIVAAALAACGGGSHVTPGATAQSPALSNYNGPAALSVSWNQGIVAKATYVGPLSGNPIMSIDVRFALRNEQGLLQYAAAASNPQSAGYRHFLTPQQIGAMFGANTGDVSTAAAYFKNYGLALSTWPQQLSGVVTGPRAGMERAFGVTFGVYRLGTQTFIAPAAGAAHFSSVVPIRSAQLAAVSLAHDYIIRLGAGAFAGNSPQQIGNGFDYSSAWSQGLTGGGITVGIIGTGPIDIGTNEVGGPFNNGGDVGLYQKTFHEISGFGLASTGTSITIVPVAPQTPSPTNNETGSGLTSGWATPPPVTASSNTCTSEGGAVNYSIVPIAGTCNPEDGEAQLDTESVAGLAPDATVRFYLGYNPAFCSTPGNCPANSTGLQGLGDPDDEIQQAIADDSADVLSLSYGLGELDAYDEGYFNLSGSGFGPDEFAALVSEGIAVFVSSGDTGNESCVDPTTGLHITTPCISYPASDPSAVGVGGVNIPLDPSGTLSGQITAWADQTTSGGNGTFGNNVGSGGGVSAVFATPVYQSGVEPAAGADPSSPQLGGMRGSPDIALDADPLTGPSELENGNFGGGFFASGGTSAAAPEAAAMWALVLEACKASSACATATGAKPYRLGNPDGLIYKIYSSSSNGLSYHDVFYDVLYGENQAVSNGGTPSSPVPGPPITGCCTAGPGYDLVTGVGSPFTGHLIQAITGTTVP
jgi:subtilase family serine protease